MLANTSSVRAQVEQCRMDVLKWLKKRWMGVKQEGGFDSLEGWALKEISHGELSSSWNGASFY
jgi:hypothetical protein